MPPRRHADKPPGRAVVQQGIAASLGTKVFVQIKVSELAKYVDYEFSIPGSFWDTCEEEDAETLYRVKVVEFDARHKFDGISARVASVRVEVQGTAASLFDNTNIWMAQDLLSKLVGAEKERRAAADAIERSNNIAAGSLVEGEAEGTGGADEEEEALVTPPADTGGGGSRGGKFFAHFSAPVLLRTVTRKTRRKSGGTVDVSVWAYQCLHCERPPVTQEGSGSGSLSVHAQTWHRNIYEVGSRGERMCRIRISPLEFKARVTAVVWLNISTRVCARPRSTPRCRCATDSSSSSTRSPRRSTCTSPLPWRPTGTTPRRPAVGARAAACTRRTSTSGTRRRTPGSLSE